MGKFENERDVIKPNYLLVKRSESSKFLAKDDHVINPYETFKSDSISDSDYL